MIISIIVLWIICGIISKKLQSNFYIKKYNFDSSFPYIIHLVFGPVALILTIFIDLL